MKVGCAVVILGVVLSMAAVLADKPLEQHECYPTMTKNPNPNGEWTLTIVSLEVNGSLLLHPKRSMAEGAAAKGTPSSSAMLHYEGFVAGLEGESFAVVSLWENRVWGWFEDALDQIISIEPKIGDGLLIQHTIHVEKKVSESLPPMQLPGPDANDDLSAEVEPLVVELVVVNDYSQWKRFGNETEARTEAIVNFADSYFRATPFPQPIRVQLIGQETITDPDTLRDAYRLCNTTDPFADVDEPGCFVCPDFDSACVLQSNSSEAVDIAELREGFIDWTVLENRRLRNAFGNFDAIQLFSSELFSGDLEGIPGSICQVGLDGAVVRDRGNGQGRLVAARVAQALGFSLGMFRTDQGLMRFPILQNGRLPTNFSQTSIDDLALAMAEIGFIFECLNVSSDVNVSSTMLGGDPIDRDQPLVVEILAVNDFSQWQRFGNDTEERTERIVQLADEYFRARNLTPPIQLTLVAQETITDAEAFREAYRGCDTPDPLEDSSEPGCFVCHEDGGPDCRLVTNSSDVIDPVSLSSGFNELWVATNTARLQETYGSFDVVQLVSSEQFFNAVSFFPNACSTGFNGALTLDGDGDEVEAAATLVQSVAISVGIIANVEQRAGEFLVQNGQIDEELLGPDPTDDLTFSIELNDLRCLQSSTREVSN